jgi:FAD/FMN-containing dehydrogenase
MEKLGQYIAEYIDGEILMTPLAADFYSTDASILQVKPQMVIFPLRPSDIQKVVRLSDRLAKKGVDLPVTARGAGTDLTGAAIGHGIVLATNNLDSIKEIDEKTGKVVVGVGTNLELLNQALLSHDLSLPVLPSSAKFGTVGGAISNDSFGTETLRYGTFGEFVEGLKVVLADGTIIHTSRISHTELNKKKGQTGAEGDIYRAIDGLIEDNRGLIKGLERTGSKFGFGYNLMDVKNADDSFDLTPLFVGSQGTLGVICEATLNTERRTAAGDRHLVVIRNEADLSKVVDSVLETNPSSLYFLDKNAIEISDTVLNRDSLKFFPDLKIKSHEGFLVVDYANNSKNNEKELARIFANHAKIITVKDEREYRIVEQIKEITFSANFATINGKVLAPLATNIYLPPNQISQFLKEVAEKVQVDYLISGNLGFGQLSFAAFLNFGGITDRQLAFSLLDTLADILKPLGGSITYNVDGRFLATRLAKDIDRNFWQLSHKIKQIFDPNDILNPGVKVPNKSKDLILTVNTKYNLDKILRHKPLF